MGWHRITTWVGALALIGAAACSSGGGNSSGAELSGPPVVVGLINTEGAAVGSFAELREAAEAAVDHVNSRGGIGGRRLVMESCIADGTPESSQSCAARLVEKSPVAVIGGVNLGAAAAIEVLVAEKVPYLGAAPTLGGEVTAQGAYLLTGGPVADLLGATEYALGPLGARRIGALYLDLPGVLSAVVSAAPSVLRARGVTEVKLVAEKADTADFTPALRSVAGADPDAIVVVFGAQSCGRIMAARKSLGIEAAMIYPGVCASEELVAAAGEGAEGAYFASGFLAFDDPNPDVATWRAQTADRSVASQAGFASVMNLASLLADTGPDPEPGRLAALIEESRDRPGFMAHPYTCDRRQVPFLIAMCNTRVRILRYTAGAFDDVAGTWVNGASLLGGSD
ncbi:MAG: ABC transporter substrate-binding protein [Acidimicrobiales bacterium]